MVIHQPHNSKGPYNYNAVTYRNVPWPPHFHKNPELCWVIEGTLEVTVNGQTQFLEPGDSALVLSNQIHAYEPAEDTVYWVGVFSEDFVPQFVRLIEGKQGKGARFRCQPAVAALVEAELMGGAEPVRLMQKACLYAVCEEYLRQVPLEERHASGDRRVGDLLQYIAEHYTEDLTLAELARRLGYEYHYLSRLLNKSYGIRFRDLLNRYRVDAARDLLEEGRLSVTEVALKSGFQSVRSFNQVFRKLVGCTPREYGDTLMPPF